MGEAPVIIVGAGPAGLAVARELRVRRIPFRLLERGKTIGHSWARLYDSLRLHTGKHLSALPGLRFPRSAPLFPSRDDSGRGDFEGRVLHSIEYQRPDPFRGQRVLVVGVGNSGGEIGAELARNGIETTLAVRSGAWSTRSALDGLRCGRASSASRVRACGSQTAPRRRSTP